MDITPQHGKSAQGELRLCCHLHSKVHVTMVTPPLPFHVFQESFKVINQVLEMSLLLTERTERLSDELLAVWWVTVLLDQGISLVQDSFHVLTMGCELILHCLRKCCSYHNFNTVRPVTSHSLSLFLSLSLSPSLSLSLSLSVFLSLCL